jgi:hypothetical protein
MPTMAIGSVPASVTSRSRWRVRFRSVVTRLR